MPHSIYILFCSIFLFSCQPSVESIPENNLLSLLSDPDTVGFKRALELRDFHFPEDHAAHPDYKNEWWYLTGNLADQQGRRFAYQLTFFRLGLSPFEIKRPSAWATQHLWMAHAAITDIAKSKHFQAERFSRGNPGMAGIRAQPFQLWMDDWQLISSNGEFPWKVHVKTKDFAFDLTLRPEKPIVLQGEQGLSRKSDTPGNASYYYSMTRLTTTGQITSNQLTFQVRGFSWLDREWGTSSLDKDQIGWDWFALQLNSGEDLMYYQLRQSSGQPHGSSLGSWIEKNGDVEIIYPTEMVLTPLKWWQSEEGERYPVHWQVEYLPAKKKWLVKALVEDQTMRLSATYWEGAVAIYDSDSGEHQGYGFVEMTGY